MVVLSAEIPINVNVLVVLLIGLKMKNSFDREKEIRAFFFFPSFFFPFFFPLKGTHLYNSNQP